VRIQVASFGEIASECFVPLNDIHYWDDRPK
jgi:hypothetical protein